MHDHPTEALHPDLKHARIFVSDTDNDHSFGQLPVHTGLTCPEGQSAWAVGPPWLAKKIRSMNKIIDQGTPLRSLAA